MKKHYYLYTGIGAIALALMLFIPHTTQALEAGAGIDVSAGASGSGSDDSSVPPPDKLLPNSRDRLRNTPAPAPKKLENIKANRDVRNVMLDGNGHAMGSTTPGGHGSSTPMRPGMMLRQEGREERKDIRDMRHDIFKMRQTMIVRQLTVAITNLKKIRARIQTRIDKAQTENKDVTRPKALLVVADGKITIAEQAVAALAAYTPPASATTTATTSLSVGVDLNKPREVAAAAIKAVKDAREALGAVVKALAQALGVKLDPTASSTPITASSTVSVE